MTHQQLNNVLRDFGYYVNIAYSIEYQENIYTVIDADKKEPVMEFTWPDIEGMTCKQLIDVWLDLK